MELLPYKQSPEAKATETAPDGVSFWTDPNGLCSGAVGHPASGALAQSVSASGLHPEGSGFEFREPHHSDNTADLLAVLKELMAWHDCLPTRNICDIQDDAKRLIAAAEVRS